MITEEVMSKFYYECDCGCGELQFSQCKDDGVAFISYNIPAYFAYQFGTWYRIKRSSKIIWSILLGREYRFYEIVIEDNKRLKEFKKWVSEMKEIEDVK